nr:putative late blight resistance protein homolog R1C-3 [Coffea arabica]
MDIQKLRLRLLNQYIPELPRPDDQVNSTYFIVKGLRDYLKLRARPDRDLSHLTEVLLWKLMLSKNLIYIATVQGVEQMQLLDLLAHCTFLAVNAECLRKLYWSVYFEKEVVNDIQSEISQLQQKIKLVDPQFRVTSVRVLKASKKLSRSPLTFTPEKNKYLVEEFVDSLLCGLRQLPECCSTFTVPVQDQMLKLHEGVKFISFLLCVQQEKFYALPEEMKHRIGVMIIDAGIVICSLSVNEMKDSLAKETELALVHLLKELQFVMEEVAQVYPLKSSQLSFPRTNELGSIDFLLENLKELAISKAGSGAFPMDQIQTVQEELLFLRSFLENIVEKRNQNERLQAFWSRAMEVAYKAEVIIDSTLAGDKLETCLDVIAGDINFVKTELAEEIYDGQTHSVTNPFVPMPSQVSAPVFYEHPVGLEDELETIIDRLVRGTMQLDIVPVVGMPGLGKTTLANSVYCHRSVDSHFHIRAWCCVSRVYSKKSLLLQILRNPVFEIFDQSLEINEDDLAENLYKLLKGNRYLIILDDVWDIKAWKLLERSLPDDSNGSRILLTSRSHDLLLDFTLFGKPHHRATYIHTLCQIIQDKPCVFSAAAGTEIR